MVMLADSEGPDQTARMRRLIWAVAVHICPRSKAKTSLRTDAKSDKVPYVYR